MFHCFVSVSICVCVCDVCVSVCGGGELDVQFKLIGTVLAVPRNGYIMLYIRVHVVPIHTTGNSNM